MHKADCKKAISTANTLNIPLGSLRAVEYINVQSKLDQKIDLGRVLAFSGTQKDFPPLSSATLEDDCDRVALLLKMELT